MKDVQFTTNKAFGEGEQRRTINREVKIGPVTMRIFTIAALASLVLFYLAQTTQSATKSYEVQALEDKKQELVDEVERLELESVRLQSLGAIKEGMGDKINTDFESAGNAEVLPN